VTILDIIFALRWPLVAIAFIALAALYVDAQARYLAAVRKVRELERRAYLTDLADPRTAGRVVSLPPRREATR
jgi:hypothetical protein